MPRIPTINSVMTAFPYFIDADARMSAAETMLKQFRIHQLAVREGDKIVGVVSDRDLKRAQALGHGHSGRDTRVGDVCTREVYVVGPDEPLDAVLTRMAETRTDVVCIVKDEKLAGIFTFTDACRRFAALLRS